VPALTASLGALGAADAARAALAAAGRPSAHGLPWDLWLIRRDGSGLRRLTRLAEDDASLAWSPDGAWLAFQGTGGLYLVHQESGRTVRLADKTEPVGIDWAP
jgi:Tol biopolymer transport system component